MNSVHVHYSPGHPSADASRNARSILGQGSRKTENIAPDPAGFPSIAITGKRPLLCELSANSQQAHRAAASDW
jgi:hypothetical protein